MASVVALPNIVALDPGGATGFALLRDDKFTALTLQPLVAVTAVEHHVRDLDREFEVVAERYTITPRTAKLTQQTDALEVIGAVRWLCWIYNRKFTLQSPGDAKRFSTNARLEQAGFLQRPLKEHDHANDASRHLLLYLVTTGQIDASTLRRQGQN